MEENGGEKKAAMQTKEELMLIVYVYKKWSALGGVCTQVLMCLGSERDPKLSTGFSPFGLLKSYFSILIV